MPKGTQDMPSTPPQAVTTGRSHGLRLAGSGLALGDHRAQVLPSPLWAGQSFPEGAQDHLPWSLGAGALQRARRENRCP